MILVNIEPVPDLNDLAVSQSQNRVFERGPRVTNPVSDHAIEEGVHLRDQIGGEADGLLIGTEKEMPIARRALAMGLDRILHFVHPKAAEFDARVRAAITAAVAGSVDAKLVLFGAATPDGFGAELAFRVSQRMKLPLTTLSERKGDPKAPCVLRIRSFVNKPRLPSAMEIIKASKKEINQLSSTILGLTDRDLEPRYVLRGISLA